MIISKQKFYAKTRRTIPLRGRACIRAADACKACHRYRDRARGAPHAPSAGKWGELAERRFDSMADW